MEESYTLYTTRKTRNSLIIKGTTMARPLRISYSGAFYQQSLSSIDGDSSWKSFANNAAYKWVSYELLQ
jgi:hypothetical protein